MSQEQLNFLVVNDPSNDFELMQEASLGDELVSLVFRENDQWFISFLIEGEEKKLPWATAEKIFTTFADFVREMNGMSNNG